MTEKLGKYKKEDAIAHIDRCLSPLFESIKEQNKQFLIAPIKEFFNKDVANFIALLIDVENGKEYSLKAFESASYDLVAKGRKLEDAINDAAIIKKIKLCFKALLGPWIYDSIILKRAFEKPRGYPGDYQLLEIIYNNAPVTDKNKRAGVYSDLHFLGDALAVAVRERKDKMKQLLKELILAQEEKNTNILNFASGSAREIRELLKESKIANPIKFSLVDFDGEALDFTRKQLKDSANIKFSFIKEDIIKTSLNNIVLPALKGQDMVYSIGLVDYLPDRILKSFIQYSYGLLKPNGQLILSHKDHTKVSTLVEDWYCDWTFYERTRDNVLEIMQNAGIPKNLIKTVPLQTEAIYFIFANKK